MPVTLHTVQSYDVPASKQMEPGAAFDALSGALINRGFDLKATNRDGGILTTEYKKFASHGTNPPFDYYMQIRALVRDDSNGRTVIQLKPTVKEQNRLNAAAYTEYELSYYTGERPNGSDIRLIESMRPGGWRVESQTYFMNVVTDVATISGVSVEQVQKNETTTPANAFTAN